MYRSFVFAASLAVSAMAQDWMRLETAPGIALTAGGGKVYPEQYSGKATQLWTASADGSWRSVEAPGQCLARERAGGYALELGSCAAGLRIRRSELASVGAEPRLAVADTANRDAVIALFRTQYRALTPAIGFTGDVGACKEGTTSPAFRNAVLQRVNYFRAMAGVADVALDETLNTLAQKGALLQSANVDFNGGTGLSHTPPASWKCFSTDGAMASGRSNLAGGRVGWEAVNAYMDEDGVLGHRRWIIFPALGNIGTGDVPTGPAGITANALYVIGPNAASAIRDGFTAWPPKGFVPYLVAYGTWSFSLPKADFSKAVLTMTDANGVAIAVNGAGPLQNGFGDNTYSWIPDLPNRGASGRRVGPRPPAGGGDLAYTIKMSGVQVDGVSKDYTYTVMLVDIADPVTNLGYQDTAVSTQVDPDTVVGVLSLEDPNPDPNPAVTYTLVDGPGSEDNRSFAVDGANVKSVKAIDFTLKSGWKIRVRADNGRPNGAFEKAFVVCPFGHPTVE